MPTDSWGNNWTVVDSAMKWLREKFETTYNAGVPFDDTPGIGSQGEATQAYIEQVVIPMLQEFTPLIIAGGLRQDFGPLSADPVDTPSAGDRYFNTTINEEMFYDGVRSKWLSVAVYTIRGGTSSISDGEIVPFHNNIPNGTGSGLHCFKGVLTGLVAYRDDSAPTGDIQCWVHDGSANLITFMPIDTAGTHEKLVANSNFNAGNMYFVFNADTTGAMSDFFITAYYRKRA